MDVQLRPGREEDASILGRICYEAFQAIANEHNFVPDFPNVEAGVAVTSAMLGHSDFYSVVAELGGKIAGSNFMDERNSIFGIGPISVDPQAQNHGIGGRLMRAAMERTEQRGAAGVRLVQAGYHCRSLSLYSKLGFEIREHLSCFQGPAIGKAIANCTVRSANAGDLEACNRLCFAGHGYHRGGELRDAIARGVATVVERAGRISGYSTQIAFAGHTVAETNDDLKALISAAPSFAGPGFLVPSRNGDLMRWCLGNGLRVTQSMTLMTIGLYNEPVAAYLPSILY